MIRTPEQLAVIEAKLIEACEWAQENGWRLEGNGEFGSERHKTCCALGALAAMEGLDPDMFSQSMIGMNPGFAYTSIGDGFDGAEDSGSNPDLYAIGQRLRARFLAEAK